MANTYYNIIPSLGANFSGKDTDQRLQLGVTMVGLANTNNIYAQASSSIAPNATCTVNSTTYSASATTGTGQYFLNTSSTVGTADYVWCRSQTAATP